MPAKYDLAVETFIRPIDLPLIHIGEKVRVQFDGWPAIVLVVGQMYLMEPMELKL